VFVVIRVSSPCGAEGQVLEVHCTLVPVFHFLQEFRNTTFLFAPSPPG
jgi:hypothetical protein